MCALMKTIKKDVKQHFADYYIANHIAEIIATNFPMTNFEQIKYIRQNLCKLLLSEYLEKQFIINFNNTVLNINPDEMRLK